MWEPRTSSGEPAPSVSPATVQDRRVRPTGVLPRSVQVWVMAGLALVILGIIVMTGSPTPPERRATEPKPEAARPVSPARVESYQETLDQRTRILQDELARLHAEASLPTPPDGPVYADTGGIGPASVDDLLKDEQRRRDYQSLFADVVVRTKRSATTSAAASPRPANHGSTLPAQASTTSDAENSLAVDGSTGEVPRAPTTSSSSSRPSATPPFLLAGDTHTLLEGTLINTVLTNRLDGSFAGPVTVLVTAPVYAHGGQVVVVPAGAKILGTASPVTGWGDSRLAVKFHRLLLPDGQTFALEQLPGLNQRGDTGLKDQVDRHYWQVFGASIAIGAISGLAQYSTRSGTDQGFADTYRQAAGASLAQSSARVLDRFLNQLPTITIREGHRITVYLTRDLTLPAWSHGRDRRPVIP